MYQHFTQPNCLLWTCRCHKLLITSSQVAHYVVPPTVSDCVPESELNRPVVLQPGGVAVSAVLQPGPHPPQSQKQLHVTAQRCSSTHQVSFYHQHSDWADHHPLCLETSQQEEPTDEKLFFFPLCHSLFFFFFGMWNVPLWFLLSWRATIWSKEEAA